MKYLLVSGFPVALGLSEKGRENYDIAFPPPKCDRCGEGLQKQNCKLVCNKCGFTRDCSDP